MLCATQNRTTEVSYLGVRSEIMETLGLPPNTTPSVVDIADMKVSGDPNEALVTYSLGSCIGVTVHDPVAGVGGLAHFMLPMSKADPEKARTRPCMFVDAGMEAFLGALFAAGVRKARAVVTLTGASRILDRMDLFQIGERNCVVFRKILWKNGMLIASEDVAGCATRTVWLAIGSGRVVVRSQRVTTQTQVCPGTANLPGTAGAGSVG